MRQSIPGQGAFVFKMALAFGYAAICAVAENSHVVNLPPEMLGFTVVTITLAPLLLVGLLYAIWWRNADEYQKVLEYRAISKAALGGLAYLVLIKLATYFVPVAVHVPSLAVVGMVLVLWISASRSLNVAALKA